MRDYEKYDVLGLEVLGEASVPGVDVIREGCRKRMRNARLLQLCVPVLLLALLVAGTPLVVLSGLAALGVAVLWQERRSRPAYPEQFLDLIESVQRWDGAPEALRTIAAEQPGRLVGSGLSCEDDAGQFVEIDGQSLVLCRRRTEAIKI